MSVSVDTGVITLYAFPSSILVIVGFTLSIINETLFEFPATSLTVNMYSPSSTILSPFA